MVRSTNAAARRVLLVTLAAGTLLALVQRVLALATEHYGNAPVTWAFGNDVLAVANLEERVYWYEVNGDPHFFSESSSVQAQRSVSAQRV